MFKKIFIGCIFMLVSNSAFAANWYVDNAVSTSGNGQSWSTAWKNFSNIVWSGAGIKSGDTLYISGGSTSKTYSEVMRVGVGGSSGSPVTIKPGSASPTPSGHDGLVIIDGGGTRLGIWGAGITGYITINGEKNGTRNIKIQNTAIEVSDLTAAIYFNAVTPIKVYYVEIVTASSGIVATYCNRSCSANVVDKCEFAYNYIHDIQVNAGIAVNGSCTDSPTWDGVLIHHNEIQVNVVNYTEGSGPDGVEGSCGGSFYNNVIYGKVGTIRPRQHQDLIQALGTYWKIYNNDFYDWGDSGVNLGVSGASGYTHIWNNTLAIKDSNRIGNNGAIRFYCTTFCPVTSITDLLIYNNTIVDITGTGGDVRAIRGGPWTGSAPTVTGTAIKNNIIYNSGVAGRNNALHIDVSANASQSDWNIDHNLVNAGTHGSAGLIANGISFTQVNGRNRIPAFVLYSEKSASNDFHLVATDTAAKDKAANLSGILSGVFTNDKAGFARHRGYGWDIGAYEYDRPEPPGNLRIQ